ncbi:transposase, partial [Streptomyces gardneri]|nr:transposase [Streptomyces gardneri]
YLPGGIFHLTARTLRREHRFTPRLRSLAVAAIADAAERADCRILAVAVMSNHLHIVAQQGDRPLSALMQPLLRRLAHRIQEAHDLEGPVFWRP